MILLVMFETPVLTRLLNMRILFPTPPSPANRLAAGRGVGIAAEIPRAQRAFAERALDRGDDRGRAVFSPRCSSIIAPDQITPTIGDALRPAIMGAEPCTGSNTDGNALPD